MKNTKDIKNALKFVARTKQVIYILENEIKNIVGKENGQQS
jgi:hypothetical protein